MYLGWAQLPPNRIPMPPPICHSHSHLTVLLAPEEETQQRLKAQTSSTRLHKRALPPSPHYQSPTFPLVLNSLGQQLFLLLEMPLTLEPASLKPSQAPLLFLSLPGPSAQLCNELSHPQRHTGTHSCSLPFSNFSSGLPNLGGKARGCSI